MTDEPLAEAAPQPQESAASTKRRRKRWPWVLGALGVVIGLFVFFVASVEVLHYTESTAFCSLCHVMKPEYTAYHNSPHARAECGSCHVGPGALPAVQAKLAAVRYLWVYPSTATSAPSPRRSPACGRSRSSASSATGRRSSTRIAWSYFPDYAHG